MRRTTVTAGASRVLVSIHAPFVKSCRSIPVLGIGSGKKTTEGLLYCLSKLSSRVRITKMFLPIPSNVAVISRMGERISGSRDVLQNYQKISRGCKVGSG